MIQSGDRQRETDHPAPAELRLEMANDFKPGARIKVVGVGGGGSNAVNRMVAANAYAIDFVVANTDAQALAQSVAPVRLQLGAKLTKGLGAGADPSIGRQAALEDTEQLIGALDGADMVFVATGLGGGTGTGAAPVIANLASELGALTVAVVTKPFAFEGKRRALQAERGLEELRDCVDTVITIPNERLLATIERSTSLQAAFTKADDVLHQAIQGISDLILEPGLINLDFADVTTIMSGMGIAVMGTGVGEGENRAVEAATKAVSSPLLEETSVQGARGVIVNVTGGPDLSMLEVSEATAIIQEAAHPEANIIFGAVIDEAMTGHVKITVIATGFGGQSNQHRPHPSTSETPVDLTSYTEWQDRRETLEDAQEAENQVQSEQSEALPAAVGGGVPIARRPMVDITRPSGAGASGAGEPLELDGGLDTPAFLRRQAKS